MKNIIDEKDSKKINIRIGNSLLEFSKNEKIKKLDILKIVDSLKENLGFVNKKENKYKLKIKFLANENFLEKKNEKKKKLNKIEKLVKIIEETGNLEIIKNIKDPLKILKINSKLVKNIIDSNLRYNKKINLMVDNINENIQKDCYFKKTKNNLKSVICNFKRNFLRVDDIINKKKKIENFQDFGDFEEIVENLFSDGYEKILEKIIFLGKKKNLRFDKKIQTRIKNSEFLEKEDFGKNQKIIELKIEIENLKNEKIEICEKLIFNKNRLEKNLEIFCVKDKEILDLKIEIENLKKMKIKFIFEKTRIKDLNNYLEKKNFLLREKFRKSGNNLLKVKLELKKIFNNKFENFEKKNFFENFEEEKKKFENEDEIIYFENINNNIILYLKNVKKKYKEKFFEKNKNKNNFKEILKKNKKFEKILEKKKNFVKKKINLKIENNYFFSLHSKKIKSILKKNEKNYKYFFGKIKNFNFLKNNYENFDFKIYNNNNLKSYKSFLEKINSIQIFEKKNIFRKSSTMILKKSNTSNFEKKNKLYIKKNYFKRKTDDNKNFTNFKISKNFSNKKKKSFFKEKNFRKSFSNKKIDKFNFGKNENYFQTEKNENFSKISENENFSKISENENFSKISKNENFTKILKNENFSKISENKISDNFIYIKNSEEFSQREKYFFEKNKVYKKNVEINDFYNNIDITKENKSFLKKN